MASSQFKVSKRKKAALVAFNRKIGKKVACANFDESQGVRNRQQSATKIDFCATDKELNRFKTSMEPKRLYTLML
jgi:hypothetical protein